MALCNLVWPRAGEFVSWWDIAMTVVRYCCLIRCLMGRWDHAEAITPQLYCGRTARQGQDNRMLHKALNCYFLPSHQYILTTGKLGHQVAHTVLDHCTGYTICSIGVVQWARSRGLMSPSDRGPINGTEQS